MSPLLLFTGWSGTRESGGVSAAFILLNSASGLAGNVASIGALPNDVWLWSGIVIVGGLIDSEIGSRRVAALPPPHGSASYRAAGDDTHLLR